MFLFLVPPDEPKDRWEWLLSCLPEREMNALFQVAYDILKNKDDVDDVIQESLVIGVTKCHQIKDEKRVFSWMYSIVRHEALAYHKKFRFHNSALLAKLALYRQPTETSAESRMIKEYDRDVLKRALEAVRSPGKEIVKMHLLQGKGFPEISQILNINYNTVRSLYRRALAELERNRKRIENE